MVDCYFIEYFGYNGGLDWGSVVVDLCCGVIVVNYNDMFNYNWLVLCVMVDRLGWLLCEEVCVDKGGVEGVGDL